MWEGILPQRQVVGLPWPHMHSPSSRSVPASTCPPPSPGCLDDGPTQTLEHSVSGHIGNCNHTQSSWGVTNTVRVALAEGVVVGPPTSRGVSILVGSLVATLVASCSLSQPVGALPRWSLSVCLHWCVRDLAHPFESQICWCTVPTFHRIVLAENALLRQARKQGRARTPSESDTTFLRRESC